MALVVMVLAYDKRPEIKDPIQQVVQILVDAEAIQPDRVLNTTIEFELEVSNLSELNWVLIKMVNLLKPITYHRLYVTDYRAGIADNLKKEEFQAYVDKCNRNTSFRAQFFT